MALVLADRVLETTTTTGSGTITLAGAEPGYQSFSAVGDGNQTYYTITADADWEVGVGTYTASGTTLSRDTVLSSSNSGNRITLPAGSKKVFVTYPSEKSVNLDVSGNISLSSAVISGVAPPSAASDAANKQYVDSLVEFGITYHSPVKYEVPNTTGNLVATYNNGSSGVGATLTNAGTLVAFVPDGVTASISDRILIYSQTNAFENGVYVVSTVGNGSTSWVLTRAADADTYALKSPNSLGGGDAFYVTSGNTGAGETYICNNSGVISFGSTAISFVQISAAQVYQAGNGISLTNTIISLDTPVTVANGGTGISSTPTNGQLLIGNGSNYTLSTLTAGSGVSITNSAGSITLSATGSGGTVTGVTASAPLASSGGTAPNISIANSTGTGSVVLDQGATISSATITAGVSASITTITGTSANITTVTGTTAGFSSANITQLQSTSATVTTLSGTNVTYSSGTVSQLAATSATIATVSGTNVTYSNGNFTSATVTTVSGTTATYASATITNLAATSITVTNTPAFVGNGTLSMAVSGTGLSGSASFTANQSGNSTFTVTSNATNANTGSTIVARDASGNFSAGTITASLNGNASTATSATSATTATTATQVSNSVTFNNGGSGAASGTTFNGSAAQTISYNTIGAPSTTGTNASGTWGISITGNAATATTASNVNNGTLTMNVSGTGLSGSQTFTANQAGNATFTVTSNATNANTGSTIVARDASGNFSAGTITATLNGNASTATSATSASNSTTTSQRAFSGDISTGGQGRFTGWYSGGAATGAATEVGYSGGEGYVLAYNRDTSAYSPINLASDSVTFRLSGGVANLTSGALQQGGNQVLHAGNYNSYAPTLTGGGASGTWSINVTGSAGSASTATTATNWGSYGAVPGAGTSFGNANTIGRSDANGYTYFSYINSSTSLNENPTISQVITTNSSDNFYRKSSIAHLTSSLSGTAPINISGNAATATTATDVNGSRFSTTAGSYNNAYTWIQFNGAHGLYETYGNGGHFYPNNASYGAWRVAGSRNGYGGLSFSNGSAGEVTLMLDNSSNVSGFYNSSYGWQFYWSSGVMYIYKNAYGGGTAAVALDSSNYTSYAPGLTGSGASGSWGISVTGSAATFTSTSQNSQFNSVGVGTAGSGTAGEIRATNNVTAYYSDARLKDFKGKIDGALDKVSQLNGYYYTENAKAEEFGYNNKAIQVGVSAQEVQAVLPEIIAPAPFDMDENNQSKTGEDYMTVRYERLVPLLIEAIKELKAEVEALKAGK